MLLLRKKKMNKNKYILALTFVEGEYFKEDNELISANIGKMINDKFVLVKSINLSRSLLNDTYPTQAIKNFELYLNDRWKNKGLLLIDSRSENHLEFKFSRLLIHVHKEWGNGVHRIICGISSRKEFNEYKEKIKE